MLRLDARDAFGSALNALNERANCDGRTARREWFGCGTIRTWRALAGTFGAFNARGLLSWLGRLQFGRSG